MWSGKCFSLTHWNCRKVQGRSCNSHSELPVEKASPRPHWTKGREPALLETAALESRPHAGWGGLSHILTHLVPFIGHRLVNFITPIYKQKIFVRVFLPNSKLVTESPFEPRSQDSNVHAFPTVPTTLPTDNLRGRQNSNRNPPIEIHCSQKSLRNL